jgi:16S rRNA (adenine1518-N6/adenine1519-N6)-dimethyltransferase
LNHRPRKRFGQHWLRSEAVLNQIVQAAQLQPTDRVLEIGPGKGVLTRRLLPLVQKVVAVEVDWDLQQLLEQQFAAVANLRLVKADFLTCDLLQLVGDDPQAWPLNKVVANIPYNITGPILESLLGRIGQPVQPTYERIVLLVQKEVAERLCAQPGSSSYGLLSARVQYLAECQLVCSVPATAFLPPPKVDSAVVCLLPRCLDSVPQNPDFLELLIQMGFAAKRKMLRNNLKNFLPNDLDTANRLISVFTELGIPPEARAETLSLRQWIALSDRLSSLPNMVCDE